MRTRHLATPSYQPVPTHLQQAEEQRRWVMTKLSKAALGQHVLEFV